MFDYHMHTTISYDGHCTPAQMAAAAAKIGLKEICFTEHRDYQLCVPREKTAFSTDAYRHAHEPVKIPGLAIRHGVEIGLTDWNMEEVHQDLQAYPYDFVIGSVHFINDEDVYYAEGWHGRDYPEMEQLYFEELLRCIQLHNDFDVLGHLTYIGKVPGHPCPRPVPLDAHRDIVEEILKTLVAKGKGMEINTSGMDRCGDFLPGIPYLKRFRELGGEIITVGADAHGTDRVGQYVNDACAIAQEIFGHVCTFQGRQPIFHKL